MVDLFNKRFTKNQLSELSGISLRQVDTLKKLEYISPNKTKYDFQSLFVCTVCKEYSNYFNYKGLRDDTKKVLKNISHHLKNIDFNEIKDKSIIVAYLPSEQLLMITVDDISMQPINDNSTNEIINRHDEVTKLNLNVKSFVNNTKERLVLDDQVVETVEIEIRPYYEIKYSNVVKKIIKTYQELYRDDYKTA